MKKISKIISEIKFSYEKWGAMIIISLIWASILHDYISTMSFWGFALVSLFMVGSGYIWGISKIMRALDKENIINISLNDKTKKES